MSANVVSRFRRSRLLRTAAQITIAAHVMAATPVLGEELTQATARASVQASKDVAETAKQVTSRSVRKATRLAADARRKVTKATMRVNRTVPKASAPNTDPMFGLNVTTEALMRARVFPEQLMPTSPPSADDNHALARTLERICLIDRNSCRGLTRN